MSTKTHVCKLESSTQNRIKSELLHNGWLKDEVESLWLSLVLADLSDFTDISEVLC